MPSNLDHFKEDLETLIKQGDRLELAIQAEYYHDEFVAALEKSLGKDKKDAKQIVANLPSFSREYQTWYSEAIAVVKQLLPDRLSDFIRHYEKPTNRKNISFENYRIEDALQGLSITRRFEEGTVVGPEGAIPHFRQQLNILKSARARFTSSLFDIRQLVAADLLDTELDSAAELAKNKFARAAGAVAGVVLEKHLSQVCENHSVKVGKKAPTISDLNDALKAAGVIDIPQWRFVQHLADIRNLCDHDKKVEPTADQVEGLIAGVRKVSKTVY